MKKTKLCAVILLMELLIFYTGCSGQSVEGPDGGEDEGPVPYIKVGTKTIGNSTYDIVTFGNWPQTIKDDSVSILDEDNPTIKNGLQCYQGSDDAWYIKFGMEHYEKYYKVEPIKWRVLTNNYDHDNNPSTPGKKLLFAESILLPMNYYTNQNNRIIGSDTIYPNNYEYSEVRAYLNGLVFNKSGSNSNEWVDNGFLQFAFTSEEQSEIAITTVINNARSTNPDNNANQWNNGINDYASEIPTSDKIFLLSEQEATKAEYGFAVFDNVGTDSTRIRIPTDFAKAKGAFVSTEEGYNGNGAWWLRSPPRNDEYINRVRHVNEKGNAAGVVNVNAPARGVVPALCLN